MTTNQDISDWFDEGVEHGDSHLLVVCDTFSYEDYPVYIKKAGDLAAKVNKYNGQNMQKIMLTIDLSKKKPKFFKHDR